MMMMIYGEGHVLGDHHAIAYCTNASRGAATVELLVLQAACPSCRPTTSVKALKAIVDTVVVCVIRIVLCELCLVRYHATG